MSYSEVKQEQEKSILEDYLDWLNEGEDEYEVIATPDPPDGIVQNLTTDETFWVEVSSSYHSDKWAIDLNSYADPDRNHIAMPDGRYMNMDQYVAEKFAETLASKLSKTSYKEAFDEYGPGALVIKVYSPWAVDDTTFGLMEEECKSVKNETGYFDEVFIYHNDGDGYRFSEWEID
ncbi:hypothetical protein [Pseudodesulfovibrio tunisiensis]|uniref:hypothetical protein n=1 Tax=Pseudodesulfovibrio tunisiensis TaxID=463192 RepID=UPI001FB2D8D2|nr:hypothetical protein [Pseudodesulfovibrio tunisiensis]